MTEEPTVQKLSRQLVENDQTIKGLRNQLAIKAAEWSTFRDETNKKIQLLEEESVSVGTKLSTLATSYVEAARREAKEQIPANPPVGFGKLFTEEHFGAAVKKFNEKNLVSKIVRQAEVEWIHKCEKITREEIQAWYTAKGFSEFSSNSHSIKLLHYIEVVEHWAYDPIAKTWNRPAVVQIVH
jgi:hypothetical protein